MADLTDPKAVLQRYLQEARGTLIWKLDRVSEHDARLPRTSTGNNLLGLLKHCLNVEAGYFGPTFGRVFPTPHELVAPETFDGDPQADWYASQHETKDGLIDLYRRVGAFADETVQRLPLDARGQVPWWPPGERDVSLHSIMVHVLADLARHCGHADILREQHDGVIGLHESDSNLPEAYDWRTYAAKLTALADRVPT